MSEPSKITNLSDEELDQVSGGGAFEDNIAMIEANTIQSYEYKTPADGGKPV